ncbi:preprotein translocase subunit SecE [Chromatium okenii]|uniref:preprotein translocase subunit SecE n=1 Tax=Chromatium okenii TaxID=61644 RepID=UPI00190458A6|nr:preprotein translocase subunit SecE [Chromatium okenii]MBK1642730.1 preprotein translocase subunit SecE [Chromatium okenii]
MNFLAEKLGVSLETFKLTVAVFLLILGITAFYSFSGISTLVRVIGLLVFVGGAAAIVFQTELGRLLWQFVVDSRIEVRKVVWPSRQETLQTTLVVIAMVLVVGIVLWLFDLILMAILRFLTG